MNYQLSINTILDGKITWKGNCDNNGNSGDVSNSYGKTRKKKISLKGLAVRIFVWNGYFRMVLGLVWQNIEVNDGAIE